MSSETKTFGKWRSRLWPIHAFELKKFLPMFFMFFFINFNYTVLRDTKDALVVTAPGSSAEVIPYIKVWLVVPMAIVFMLIFAKLSNMLRKETLFYTVCVPFLVFFALFAWVIYPNRESLHPTAFADWMQTVLPGGCRGLVSITRNWTFAMFYVMAELWGSVMMSLMFWGFANDTTRASEAKRFYAVFGIGANLALLVSGPLIVYYSDIRRLLPVDVDAWGVSLNYLMAMVVFAGIMTMLIYRWINRNVLTDARFYDVSEVKKAKEKPKMSMVESFKYLCSSKYLGCLALLVIGYGVAINLVEVSWKGRLAEQFPNSNDYNAFMGRFSFMTGAITVCMMLFVGGNVMRRFGWTVGAMVTPVMLLVTGVGFFSFIIFGDYMTGLVAALGTTPLMLAVIIGAVQNILSKSCKYSMFDPTKEMAYIPLDPESKTKGKAAIDVVGARLGKMGGSAIQMALFFIGPLATVTPYVALTIFFIIAVWILAARSLGKQFSILTHEKEEMDATKKVAATSSAEPVKA